MNELRWNPLARQWVTIATDQAARPPDFAARFLPVEADPGRPCPFCPGHEDDFPPALESMPVTANGRLEQGTGALINIVAPERAAQKLVRQDAGGA